MIKEKVNLTYFFIIDNINKLSYRLDGGEGNKMNLFFIEWIMKYNSTSKYEMTPEIEALGILGTGILMLIFCTIGCGFMLCVGWLSNIIKNRRKRKR